MKKLLLLLTGAMCLLHSVRAQNPTYQEKLYYTCKMWGFVKYYHSEVSTCQVNWDSVLVNNLPDIKNAVTNADFNNEMLEMLNAAGPMALTTNQLPDILPAELKRNRDFGWINDPVFSTPVKTILDTIKNNFLPHNSCWVMTNDYTGNYYGWLVFPKDSLMLNSSTFQNYPDEFTRLNLLFRYWNIIRYFNPYNYVLDTPWDTVLFNHAEQIANAADPTAFFKEFKKVAHHLDDAHTEGLTWSNEMFFPGFYTPGIVLRHIPNKYIVVKSNISGISVGDEITSVNGLTTQQWEDSLRPYISSGNPDVFYREMCGYLIGGNYNSAITIGYKDAQNVDQTLWAMCNQNPYNTILQYYPNDTLDNVNWATIQCDIGYVNMGNLEQQDVAMMYNDLKNKSAIIFDIRNYPNGTAWDIADLMYPAATVFAKGTVPDVTYPGTFYWYYGELGLNNNPEPYNGKVILLFNEQTQSQAEYSCMILEQLPDVVKIGSQTAGADGNITYFNLSEDIQAGYTNLGIYYPNGDSTQRIGIVPDITVYPTQQGIRDGKDEVLEAALTIGCALSTKNIAASKPIINAYPNPATYKLNVTLNNITVDNAMITVTDVTGKTLLTNNVSIQNNTGNAQLDVKGLAPGMYMLIIKTGDTTSTQKFVKQ